MVAFIRLDLIYVVYEEIKVTIYKRVTYKSNISLWYSPAHISLVMAQVKIHFYILISCIKFTLDKSKKSSWTLTKYAFKYIKWM